MTSKRIRITAGGLRFVAESHPDAPLTVARMRELAPVLLGAAAELGPLCNASSLFGRPPLGKG